MYLIKFIRLLRLVFTNCTQKRIGYGLVKTAFWFCLRLCCLRSAYDVVTSRWFELEAEAEELNQSQSMGTYIVIGSSFRYYFLHQQSGFH